MLYSTENQECCCGGDSLFRNSQINVLETKLIMERAGRCLSTMGPTNTITSLFHQRLRKIQNALFMEIAIKPIIETSLRCMASPGHDS